MEWRTFNRGGVALGRHNGSSHMPAITLAAPDRSRLIVSDAGDVRRRIPADSRQGLQLHRTGREAPAMLRHDLLGCQTHPARATVITEAAPRREDVGFAGRR